jgi:hypothetical protein
MDDHGLFDEKRFKERVDSAIVQLKRILHNERHPQYPADVFHQYDDKFMLIEFLGASAVAALFNCLTVLGMTPEYFQTMSEWSKTTTVSTLFLTFAALCSSTFFPLP